MSDFLPVLSDPWFERLGGSFGSRDRKGLPCLLLGEIASTGTASLLGKNFFALCLLSLPFWLGLDDLQMSTHFHV